MTEREAVGKRVFCSNRYQHTGCGRTVQLYVATEIPALRYATAQLLAFLSALLANAGVRTAYQAATGQLDARHGWRWLKKLTGHLVDFRCVVSAPLLPPIADFSTRCRRLRLLLPTLEPLFAQLPSNPCAHYQQQRQHAFI